MSLEKLAQMSNKYGSAPEYVLAGGGNTSFKDAQFLYVKGSGTSLADIKPEDFVVMERDKLSAMMQRQYPASDKEREAAALADMMAAREPSQQGKRPSVETLLHNLFPQSYVLHVHPALVNGLTCGKDGERLCKELFGNDAVWVEICKPGYVLALQCGKALEAHKAACGKEAQILILQNHGIFLAADSTEEIDSLCSRVMTALKARISAYPDFSAVEFDRAKAAAIAPAVRMLFNQQEPSSVLFTVNAELQKLVYDEKAFAPLAKPFTPDHIVYCKAYPLFVEAKEDMEEQLDLLEKSYHSFVKKHGFAPKVVAVEKLGVFVCGKNMKEAYIAQSLLLDSVKIAVYSQGFGGPNPMKQEYIDFIINWEVESYRQKVSLSAEGTKRLTNKIAVVTGSAQGFGKGIAEEMAAQGAKIVVADLNLEGAKACAEELNGLYGAHTAIAVQANVSDEASVQKMIEDTVLAFGGLDIFVNNAGIAKAGSLEEMTKSVFELVTSVNYTAYFLCAKYASRVMKTQHRFAPDYYMDIIEINSKSGLTGSNKNFAYAGSKFGGIGLTQSFALELVPYNIKVNAVCPGNFFEGPLWSDPEKGLFVQYLHAGKVPGAKNVADVKKYYESKVPMNRGCTPKDVARAIFYITEQVYETGQAIPVTGGQEMLK